MPQKKSIPGKISNQRKTEDRKTVPLPKPASAKRSAQRGLFPIVGLGASAGGLEALEKFISNIPAESGLAFVVVTHQHPGHVSLLPELLQRHTDMCVQIVIDGSVIEPNCIYLSPSDGYVEILNGTLQVEKPDVSGSLQLPIDHFFCSLADDRKDKAIGIVLSGTGSDGTLGLKAIKNASGRTLAQELDSAKFPGMPSSAMDKGLVDCVLPAEQMPQQLLRLSKANFPSLMEKEASDDTELSEPMQKIILLLRSRTGNDFSAYKASTIRRRIERRITIHQLKGPQPYLQFLRENPKELQVLFKELLIGVTQFFRDAEAFDALAQTVLPQLLSSRPENSTIRVWVPACATGEEAYSLAILLREAMDGIEKHFTIQVFGTDLDDRAIDTARAGHYPESIAREIVPGRLARFFLKEAKGYRVRKEIRETVIFATHNILKDPPFTKLAMVACRNLLIYFRPEAQRRVLDVFRYAPEPGGILFLGSSESINSREEHFSLGDKKWKIFLRKESSRSHAPLPERPFAVVKAGSRPELKPIPPEGVRNVQLSAVIEKMLLKNFAPTSVIVSERGDIAYIHGRTGKFLEVAGGQPRLNILEMAREGLRVPLASALRRAIRHKGKIGDEIVRVQTDGHFANVRLTVTRLTEPETIRDLLLITFLTVKDQKLPPVSKSIRRSEKRSSDLVSTLEKELRHTKETLQSTVEQLESSNGELQSTNEEMQSANEELQSVNEELETSKEEMQSLNEELQTVNAQLQSKVDDLGVANDDMQNLLNSTEIATIFLDQEFRIKRFTAEATKLIKLIPSDIGRPIADLASNLDYKQLHADAVEIMRKLGVREREVRMKNGEWRQVRITPYRTTENVIDGLVVTFTDINRLKIAEEATLRGRAYAESIVATVREPLVVLDEDLKVVSANGAFCRTFAISAEKIKGQIIYEANNGQWSIPRLRKLLEDILPKNTTIEDFEMAHTFQRVGFKVLLINARRLKRESTMPGMILLALEDKSSQGKAKSRRSLPKKRISPGRGKRL